MNELPIGGMLVAPDSLVGEDVIVDFKKLSTFAPLFFCKFLILHLGIKSEPIFGDLISVRSINCILSFLVRLYVSFPTDTLR